MFFQRIGYSSVAAAAAGATSNDADNGDSDGNGAAQQQQQRNPPRSPRGAIRARHAAVAANAAAAAMTQSIGFNSSSSSSSFADEGGSNNSKRPGGEKGLFSSSSSSSSSSFLGVGSSALLTALACLSWMSVSSLLILLNKHLLASGFHYPMALSCLGMLFSSVAAFVCCRVVNIVDAPRKNAFSVREYCAKVVPIGLLMSLTLYLGNVVYLYLTVSFIQMLKAFTPVVTMAALFAAGLERPRRDLVGAVAAIAGGTALASLGEVNLSLVGVACMAASEGFEAARLVLTQTLLTPAPAQQQTATTETTETETTTEGAPSSSSSSSSSSATTQQQQQRGRSLGPIEGLMYLAPACSFWLLAGSAVLELPAMLREGAVDVVTERPLAFLAAAAMGFACNALAYAVIRRAGSLTLKVLGTVKNVAVVGAGMAAFGDVVTPLQGVGYAISVAGFVSYQRVKAGGGKSGSGGSGSEIKMPPSAFSSSAAAAALASRDREDEEARAGLVLENKIEAVSSFLIPSSIHRNGSIATAADVSAAAAATAATDSGEKRPLLPASFSASAPRDAMAATMTKNNASFFSSSSPAPPGAAASSSSFPLSTVDAIAAKLSGIFSFGAAQQQQRVPFSAPSDVAASRV